MASRFKPRSKKPIGRKSYLKYLKRKHDYVKCSWCNRVIKKDSNYCQWCSKPNLDYPYPEQLDESWHESVHLLNEELSKLVNNFATLYHVPLGFTKISSNEGNKNSRFPNDIRQTNAQEIELKRFIDGLAGVIDCIQGSEKLENVIYKFKYSENYKYSGMQITFDFNKS